MGNVAVGFTFVLILNTMFILAQASILELNPDEPVEFYNCNGTVFDSSSINSQCTGTAVVDTSNYSNTLPGISRQISEDSGFGFVDIFTSTKSWFQEKTAYTLMLLGGPYNMLKAIPGLPSVFVVIIGTFWYALSLFLIVAFIFGRD